MCLKHNSTRSLCWCQNKTSPEDFDRLSSRNFQWLRSSATFRSSRSRTFPSPATCTCPRSRSRPSSRFARSRSRRSSTLKLSTSSRCRSTFPRSVDDPPLRRSSVRFGFTLCSFRVPDCNSRALPRRNEKRSHLPKGRYFRLFLCIFLFVVSPDVLN